MSHCELDIEVEKRCLSIWEKLSSRRCARVTLLVDYGDRLVIVTDASRSFWFLPGGGVEQNESIEETAKREAEEELGLKVEVRRIIKTFDVTLTAKETKERLKVHPFIAVYAVRRGGQLKAEYSPKRKIVLVKKGECCQLLRDLDVPKEYECLKPYLHTSKEIIQEFLRHNIQEPRLSLH